jgi:hypothetical protein
VAAAATLAGIAERAGLGFECYYDAYRAGRHFGGGDPVLARPGWTAGSTVSGGRHAEHVLRLASAYDVLALGEPHSVLWPAIEAAGRFAVSPLGPQHRQLADRFAGLLPAPGGLFRDGDWTQTAYGPVPGDAGTWAGCLLADSRPCGYALLVEATVEHVEIGAETPLAHVRGRYRDLG